MATLERQGRLKPRSRFQRWRPVTRVEMKAFIAAVLNMGIIQVNMTKSTSMFFIMRIYVYYWVRLKTTGRHPGIHRIPFFGNLMPRDRFQEIFRLLHISHPDPSHPDEKINYNPYAAGASPDQVSGFPVPGRTPLCR